MFGIFYLFMECLGMQLAFFEKKNQNVTEEAWKCLITVLEGEELWKSTSIFFNDRLILWFLSNTL